MFFPVENKCPKEVKVEDTSYFLQQEAQNIVCGPIQWNELTLVESQSKTEYM